MPEPSFVCKKCGWLEALWRPAPVGPQIYECSVCGHAWLADPFDLTMPPALTDLLTMVRILRLVVCHTQSVGAGALLNVPRAGAGTAPGPCLPLSPEGPVAADAIAKLVEEIDRCGPGRYQLLVCGANGAPWFVMLLSMSASGELRVERAEWTTRTDASDALWAELEAIRFSPVTLTWLALTDFYDFDQAQRLVESYDHRPALEILRERGESTAQA
jgi:hypothetical protein